MKTLAIVLGILAMAGGAGWATFEVPQMLDVRVVDMDDPTLSDRITDLWVDLHNPGPLDVTPNFVTPGNGMRNWYAWDMLEGPPTLAAGDTARYHLQQLPYTGIPVTEGFRVLVNDVHEKSIWGSTGVVQPHLTRRPPAVLNPAFDAWVPSMFHDEDLPYGWVPWEELHGSDRTTIIGADGRLKLRLELDTNRTKGSEWSLLSVRQRIDFPERLHIEFVNGTRSSYAVGARTEVGVLLEDVYGNTQVAVWFAEPPTDADQAAAIDLKLGPLSAHRILVTNRTLDLDLLALYRDLGWHVPARQEVPRLLPHGPSDVGIGAASVLAGLSNMEIVRPMELKVLVASYPPHEHGVVEAEFSFVGGPAWEPAPSRLT